MCSVAVIMHKKGKCKMTNVSRGQVTVDCIVLKIDPTKLPE